MPDGFKDIFGSPDGSFFGGGPLPPVPTAGDVQSGPNTRDMFGGALNAGAMLIPGLNAVSGAYNMGQGAAQGFDKGQYGNIDTVYQMGGGDGGDFRAPQPSQHDSVFGSQKAGNLLYGGGISGWLGDVLGQIAGGISTIGDSKIDASPDIGGFQMPAAAPMSVPDYIPPTPVNVGLRNEPTYTGTVTDPGAPDYSQMQPADPAPSQPDPASQPWQGIGSMADLMGTPWFSDTRDAAFPNFMAGAGFGGAGYGYGASGGGGYGGGGGQFMPQIGGNGFWPS